MNRKCRLVSGRSFPAPRAQIFMAQTQTWSSPAKPEEGNQLPLVFSPRLVCPTENEQEEAASPSLPVAARLLAVQGLWQ